MFMYQIINYYDNMAPKFIKANRKCPQTQIVKSKYIYYTTNKENKHQEIHNL